MRALFRSMNLMGDGLNISPALREWHKRNPEYEIDLLTLPDYLSGMYARMGVPLRVVTDEADLRRPYDFEFNFDVGIAFKLGDEFKLHMTEAYSRMLLGEGQGIGDFKPTYEPIEEEHRSGLILISPFSRSCASKKGEPANKMLPWHVWHPIIQLLRFYGEIGVLGGPGDSGTLNVAENEMYLGLPLNQVALMLRDAKLLVTIDNGLAHLAGSQGTSMIEFYPACLSMHWAMPMGNPKMVIAQIDPARLEPYHPTRIEVSYIMDAVRSGIRQLVK